MKEYQINFKPEYDKSVRVGIKITAEQAEGLRIILGKASQQYFDLHDDTGDYIETIDKRTVRGITKIGESEIRRNDNVYMICDYGTKHIHTTAIGFEECNCAKRFGNISGITFWRLCREKYGVEYPEEITSQIQDEMEVICRAYNGDFPKPPVIEEKKDSKQIGSIASKMIETRPQTTLSSAGWLGRIIDK